MIRSLRVFFLTRALREKLLLVAFIAIGALWWLSAFGTRAAGFWQAQRTTTAQLKEQAEWIRNQKMIEETAKKTASQLEPAKTLNGQQLVIAVLQIANDAGLRNNTQTSGGTTSTRSGQFAVHSQEFTIRNIEGLAGWEALSRFYEGIQRRSPYISIERFTLSALTGNSSQLVLNLRLASVEIVQ